MIKQLRLILPLVFFVIVIFFLWRGLSLHPNQVPSPLIGKPAPAFLLPTLLNKKPHTSQQDLLGHVTLVNVWATWCVTCAEEHEELMRLARDEHVFIYGIDYKDDAAAALKWLAEKGNPYSLIAVDQMGKVAIDWGVYGTPETFILDKHAIIRYKVLGPLDANTWETLVKPIISHLEKESP